MRELHDDPLTESLVPYLYSAPMSSHLASASRLPLQKPCNDLREVQSASANMGQNALTFGSIMEHSPTSSSATSAIEVDQYRGQDMKRGHQLSCGFNRVAPGSSCSKVDRPASQNMWELQLQQACA
jgi:hypothetical protein